MSKRPILFSTPMVRAIMDGRKTVTRRVVTSRTSEVALPWDRLDWSGKDNVFAGTPHGGGPRLGGFQPSSNIRVPHRIMPGYADDTIWRVYPRINEGDLLWVRETWAPADPAWGLGPDIPVVYRADHLDPRGDAGPIRWRPSIHMRKGHARIWLRAVSVQPERLQDITKAEILREGVGRSQHLRQALFGIWATGWDALNAKRGYSWASNPWVWRIEFEGGGTEWDTKFLDRTPSRS